MQSDSAPSTSRPARRWPWLLGAFGLLLLLLGLFAHRPRSGVETRLAQLKAWGYPTTAADLNRWVPPLPDDQNLCHIVIAAAETLHVSKDAQVPYVSNARIDLNRGEAWEAEVLKASRQYAVANEAAFQRIPELLQLPRGRNDLDFRQGPNLLLPHLAKYKSLAQALAVKGGLEAEEQHPEAALDAVRASLAVARSLEDEPLLISQLVRIAIEAIAVRNLELILNRVRPGEAALMKVQEELQKRGQRSLLDRALIGELCSSDVIFSYNARQMANIGTGNGAPPGGDWRMAGFLAVYRATGLLASDRAAYIEHLARLIEIARMDPWERKAPMVQWEADLMRMKSTWYRGRFLTAMLLPALANAAAKDAAGLATARVGQVGVAIERYRGAHGGTLPTGLNDLVPKFLAEVPLDPVDGKPLRYERRDSGYVVYAFGRDGDDDHGRERMRNQGNDDYDITFIMER